MHYYTPLSHIYTCVYCILKCHNKVCNSVLVHINSICPLPMVYTHHTHWFTCIDHISSTYKHLVVNWCAHTTGWVRDGKGSNGCAVNIHYHMLYVHVRTHCKQAGLMCTKKRPRRPNSKCQGSAYPRLYMPHNLHPCGKESQMVGSICLPLCTLFAGLPEGCGR